MQHHAAAFHVAFELAFVLVTALVESQDLNLDVLTGVLDVNFDTRRLAETAACPDGRKCEAEAAQRQTKIFLHADCVLAEHFFIKLPMQ